MDGYLEKKLDLIRQANELKLSTEWKKATEKFIELQKQWREIGAVPRKKSEQLWKQFRGACDEFFAERDKNASPENNYYANLKAKKKLIEDIKAYVPADADADKEAAAKFAADFQAIGFVPFKEKDNVNAAFREAMAGKFPSFVSEGKGGRQRSEGRTRERSAKDILIQQYKTLQQEIETFENNIGFFAASKNSEALIKQMESKIAKAKDELRALEERIRKEEEGEQ